MQIDEDDEAPPLLVGTKSSDVQKHELPGADVDIDGLDLIKVPITIVTGMSSQVLPPWRNRSKQTLPSFWRYMLPYYNTHWSMKNLSMSNVKILAYTCRRLPGSGKDYAIELHSAGTTWETHCSNLEWLVNTLRPVKNEN